MARVHLDAAGLRHAAHAERGLELVQQASVIGVAVVFEIKLPVSERALPVVAENPDRLAEQPVQVMHEDRSEIILKRLGIAAEAGEDHAAMRRHVQLPKTVLGHIEVGAHAALSLEPAAERDAQELAVEAVAPAMIDADMIRGISTRLSPNERAPMRTAIDHGVDRAVLGAIDDHRRVADHGRTE